MSKIVECFEPEEVEYSDQKRKGLFKGTALSYVRMRADKHEKVYNLPEQAQHLRALADEVENKERLFRHCLEGVIERYNSYFQKILGSTPDVYKKSNEDHYCFIPAHRTEHIITYLDKARQHIRAKRKSTITAISKPIKFLDCGCGIGNIMLIARAIGYKVYGIEYEETTCKVARDLTWKGSCPRRQKKNDAVVHGDITEFDHYADYDVIYYYTPIKDRNKRRLFLAKLADDTKVGAIIISYGMSDYFSGDTRFEKIPGTFGNIYEKVA